MLTQRVDLFDSTYGHFTKDVLATIRRETFGQDIGPEQLADGRGVRPLDPGSGCGPSSTSSKWRAARAARRLTAERRLSRIAYLVEKPAD